MKPNRRLLLIVLCLPALVISSFAQEPNPREQFQVAVAAYQKTPTREAALKVIELYKQLDPPPAVPEEAREPFVMGATVLKEAGDPAGAAKAVELFTQAVRIAPWWAEARYNRALAHETAGKFDAAIRDLTLYLSFNIKEDERREAQDKIYALKAKAQLAADRKAETEKIAKAAALDFSGVWIDPDSRRISIKENGENWVIELSDHGAPISVSKSQGRRLKFERIDEYDTWHYEYELSADGRTINVATIVSFSASQLRRLKSQGVTPNPPQWSHYALRRN